MDKRRADIERALRREEYPKLSDPWFAEEARRRGRPSGGAAGSEPSPVEPRGGGGLSGGAAAAFDPDEDR
jgi:hypothetical protein